MKISILLISYNHEKYIPDAIESILMQKNDFDTEIIFLDDASTDRTFGLASAKLTNFPQARVIQNETNLGITKNYQKGFGLCTGEYVFVLEGDDYWLDIYKVERQVKFLSEHPFHSMCFHPFMIQEGVSRSFKPFVLPQGLVNFPDYDTYGINDLIATEGLIGTFSVCCYRKKFLDQLPDALFDLVAYDWAVNLFMAHFGLLGRINSIMGVYRMAEKATWSKKTGEEQVAVIRQLIPQYDRALNYHYSALFKTKLESLSNASSGPSNVQESADKSRMPLFTPKLWKWLVSAAAKK